MHNPRTYCASPYRVAVLHGGPGAPGSATPLARALANHCSILEPLQTADTITGQVDELRQMLQRHAHTPVTLIGHSWGAILGFIFAATHPALTGKLIIIGAPPFQDHYAASITATRLRRLDTAQRTEARQLLARLDSPTAAGPLDLARLGELFMRSDTVAPLSLDTETIEVQEHIYRRVWAEASAVHRSGKLLALGKHVRCPVLALHGAGDPHPAEGVRAPLAAALSNFRIIVLPRCGHYPWLERHARDRLFTLLRQELSQGQACPPPPPLPNAP